MENLYDPDIFMWFDVGNLRYVKVGICYPCLWSSKHRAVYVEYMWSICGVYVEKNSLINLNGGGLNFFMLDSRRDLMDSRRDLTTKGTKGAGIR